MTPPDISRNEAAAALDDIQQIVAHTRRAIVAAHTADHLIVWGLAWMLGFGAATSRAASGLGASSSSWASG